MVGHSISDLYENLHSNTVIHVEVLGLKTFFSTCMSSEWFRLFHFGFRARLEPGPSRILVQAPSVCGLKYRTINQNKAGEQMDQKGRVKSVSTSHESRTRVLKTSDAEKWEKRNGSTNKLAGLLRYGGSKPSVL